MDARFVTCKTAKYSVLCLAGKPIATPEVCSDSVPFDPRLGGLQEDRRGEQGSLLQEVLLPRQRQVR